MILGNGVSSGTERNVSGCPKNKPYISNGYTTRCMLRRIRLRLYRSVLGNMAYLHNIPRYYYPRYYSERR